MPKISIPKKYELSGEAVKLDNCSLQFIWDLRFDHWYLIIVIYLGFGI